MERHCADVNRNFVTGFVMEKSAGARGMGGLDGSRRGSFFTAEFTAGVITMEKRISYARLAYDFGASMTCNAFSAVAPKDESLLQVDNA